MELREKLMLFYQSVYRLDFGLLTDCSSVFDRFSLSTDDNKKFVSELFLTLGTLFPSLEFDILNEATFHHIIYFISIYCEGKCFSEMPCSRINRKRFDLIIFNSNNVGIILELKYGDVVDKDNNSIKNADAGLNQILKNKYTDEFKNENYNTEKINVKYVLVGLHLSADKHISLSVLLNNDNYNEKINFSLKNYCSFD